MVPDLARVREEPGGVVFPGPGLQQDGLKAAMVGGLIGLLVLVPLGWPALIPMLVVMALIAAGVAAEVVRHRGWVLAGRTLEREGFGASRQVQTLRLDGGPGDLLTLWADGEPLCRSGPENGGLERMLHVAERIAEGSGLPLKDQRPTELWLRWSAGDRGMAVLAWRYQRSNEVHGLIPPASEPAGVRWEHDRCDATIAGVPVRFEGDEVRIGAFTFPVRAFRQAAVLRSRDNGDLYARIGFVAGDGVHETPAFEAARAERAGEARWLLERIQERIVDRGAATEVPQNLASMRSREPG